MSEIVRKKYCVNGEWKDSKTDKWMPVTNSSTGEVLAEVPCCTPEEVEEAIASAQAAFPEWSQKSLSARTQMMFKWRNVLTEHLDELTLLCSKELGKTLSEAKGDVLKRPPVACGPYNLVFLDPPYALAPEDVLAFLETLREAGALTPDVLVSYEHSTKTDAALDALLESSPWQSTTRRHWKDTSIDFLAL